MSPEAKTGHYNGPASSSLGEAIALAGEAIAPAGVEEDDEVPKEAAVMAQMKPGGAAVMAQMTDEAEGASSRRRGSQELKQTWITSRLDHVQCTW